MEKLEWTKSLPIGVSKAEYYSSFGDLLLNELPTSLVVSPDMLVVLRFYELWKSNPEMAVEGPYTAGWLDGVTVDVDPDIRQKVKLTGRNGKEIVYQIK